MLIGIAGDSGSGKTTLSNALRSIFEGVFVLECDRYHKWERNDENWKKFTHLNPEANNLPLMEEHIKTLKSKEKIRVGDYNHETGKFTELVDIDPVDKIIVVGLHTLYYPELYDLRIFMDTDQDLKKHWKVNRDVKERGYLLHQVLDSIKKREADYNRFILQQRSEADLIIRLFEGGAEFSINNSFDLSSITKELNENRIGYTVSFDDLSTLSFSHTTPLFLLPFIIGNHESTKRHLKRKLPK